MVKAIKYYATINTNRGCSWSEIIVIKIEIYVGTNFKQYILYMTPRLIVDLIWDDTVDKGKVRLEIILQSFTAGS